MGTEVIEPNRIEATVVMPSRRGPRGNLAQFYRDRSSELEQPISPLNYARIDEPDWFARTQHLVLNLRYGIKVDNLGFAPAMITHVVKSINQMAKVPIGNQFVVDPLTNCHYPDLQVSGVRRERAIELGKALMAVTRNDPYIIRHAVLGYLYAANDRMQVVLTGHQYAPYGRVLISLVGQIRERLDHPWLTWRLVGFEVDGERGDLAGWLVDLSLEPDFHVEFTKANTAHNKGELDHIRIDVCSALGKHRLSREFQEVMVLAAATELWKCVRPKVA